MSILLRVEWSITYKQPAKCTTKSDDGDCQSNAIELFVSLVPHAQIESHSRSVSAFRHPQKYAGSEESSEILGDTREGAGATPHDSESRKPEPRRREFEDDATGKREQDITNVGGGQRREELVSGLL